ncbi:MAG TPA: Bax inhibitor-1/YccA family protein, partial [Mycobacteriales bacterium]
MSSNNPVLGRDPWRQDAASNPYQGQYSQPQYQQAPGQYAPTGYGAPVAAATDRMTVEDVVMKTLTLLGVVLVAGAASWTLIPPLLTPIALFGALGIGLVLGLIISFKQVTNPVAIIAYAAVEGVLLGQISKFYEDRFNGIVLSAVIA